MVAWYKHDIPAWMDGTESLSDGAYRVYHVVCQLMYLNEGPITLNERGIAGRCGQSARAFRKHLDELILAGKLVLENGRLDNARVEKELENVETNRENAGKGGKKSRNPNEKSRTHNEKSRKVDIDADKPLKNNDAVEAPLKDDVSLKTRLDETRRDEKQAPAGELRKAIVQAFEAANSPNLPDTSRAELWLSQGYDAAIVAAVVKSVVARKPSITTLSYFDSAIREAHEQKRPPSAKPIEIDWPSIANNFARFGHWPGKLGPEPGYPGCRCPRDALEKHGIDPETGQKRSVAASA